MGSFKKYIENITELDGVIVKEMILNHMDYLECINDERRQP